MGSSITSQVYLVDALFGDIFHPFFVQFFVQFRQLLSWVFFRLVIDYFLNACFEFGSCFYSEDFEIGVTSSIRDCCGIYASSVITFFQIPKATSDWIWSHCDVVGTSRRTFIQSYSSSALIGRQQYGHVPGPSMHTTIFSSLRHEFSLKIHQLIKKLVRTCQN